MSSVQDELNKLGRDIINDAKKNAAKNKKTGTLERSLNYNTAITNDDKFALVLEEVYYGKYLNNKTEFMDKAISRNLDRGIDSIVEVQINELLNDIL